MISPVSTAYREGYEYGVGVTAASGFRAGQAVEGEVTGVQGAGGGSQSLIIVRIESTEKLEDSLGISASASGGVGLFSASARFNFAKNCEIQSSSINLLLTHELRFGFMQIDRPRLAGDIPSAVLQNPTQFGQRYGELFCVGMSTGGLFYAVLKIECSSMANKETVSAAMGGSYGTFSVEAQVNLSQALARTNSRCEIKLYTEGGSVHGRENPMTPADVLATHETWYRSLVDESGHATDLAMPYQVLLMPYSIVEGPPPPNEADLQHQRDVLMRCAQLRSEVWDRLNLVSYMLLHPNYYEYGAGTATVGELSALKTRLAKDLDQISRAASHALNDVRNAVHPEGFPPPSGAYVFAELPDNLPPLQGATPVAVPNFSSCNSRLKVMEMATAANVTAQVVANGPVGAFRVISQKPPANELVPPGGTATIYTTQSAPPPRIGDAQRRILIPI